MQKLDLRTGEVKTFITTVELTTIDPMLGSLPNNKNLAFEYIISKNENTDQVDEELSALDSTELFEKGLTVFPRDENGNPCIYDYQIRGMFKDACGMLARAPGTKSKGLKAYKKVIDGNIFVTPRMIPIQFDGDIGICQRPLRASTPQGERNSLAASEEIAAGAKIRFNIICLDENLAPVISEWLNYGAMRGLGQWRNSGKGRFIWRIVD